MNELKKTTKRLTIIYSVVFFLFIWSYSIGIYIWTNNALGKGYVNRINEIIERSDTKPIVKNELSDDTATIAADVALDRMRNIILGVNGIALVLIPTLSYMLSRRSLRPLIQSQVEQQKFITNASHELRTPLAVIAGELELAARHPRKVIEYQATITSTSKEVHRMTKLVEGLLLLARIGTIHDIKDASTFSADSVLCEAVDVSKNQAKTRGVKLKRVGAGEEIIYGKQELLVVAMGNLVHNAIKFSDKLSTIYIETRSENNTIVIVVKNSGPIIPREHLAHLFERFYQADTAHSIGGYGLGLAITKQIIELHGGTISVQSHDNQTHFKVAIPLYKKK